MGTNTLVPQHTFRFASSQNPLIDDKVPLASDATDSSNNTQSAPPPVGNITLIIDGFNAPISAGNFIDLCQRGFYNKLPLKFDKVRSGKKGETEIDLVVGGRYKTGFVDPITGKQRRVPLEIMRAEAEGNKPFYGQARNTGLFTRWGWECTQLSSRFRITHPSSYTGPHRSSPSAPPVPSGSSTRSKMGMAPTANSFGRCRMPAASTRSKPWMGNIPSLVM